MNEVIIFHNPDCGTSRNALALLREKGIEPKVVEYLKVGWTAPLLAGLARQMGKSPRELLRVRGTDAEALGLTKPDATDAQVFAAMLKDPALVERPIVLTSKGAALCRPAETVLDLL